MKGSWVIPIHSFTNSLSLPPRGIEASAFAWSWKARLLDPSVVLEGNPLTVSAHARRVACQPQEMSSPAKEALKIVLAAG